MTKESNNKLNIGNGSKPVKPVNKGIGESKAVQEQLRKAMEIRPKPEPKPKK